MKNSKFIKRLLRFICVFAATIFLIPSTACETSGQGETDRKNASYDVSDTYFSEVTYKKNTLTNVNLKTGERTYEYVLSCTASCAVSLYEYKAQVSLLDSESKLIEQKTVSQTKDIAADTDFTFEVKASSQIAQAATASLDVDFSGKSHEKPGEKEEKGQKTVRYRVTFVANNGTTDTKTVESGKTVATPSDPKKEDYIFSGWYTEQTFIHKYDFSAPVNQDLTLYAKYSLDAVALTNKITTDKIRGIVKIYNKCYNTFLGIETSSSTSQGSGFCFHIQDGFYYILTNCHVAKKISSYDKQKYTVEDYKGQTYEGHLYQNPTKSASAIDPAYDLACLYFKPSSTNVQKLNFSYSKQAVYTDVISLGAPKSQSNSITYGKILNYRKISLKDTPASRSNVTFDVIHHDAMINNGSSGGPLLNADLEVVGVNYAGASSTKDGYAIPVDKVREFLRKYVYN